MQTAEIPALKVRRAGIVAPPPPASQRLESITLAVALRSDDRIRVEGMGLDSVWRANVRVTGTAAAPQIFGRATLQEGEFTFASSAFKITSGTLTFNGPPLDSAVNIQADTTAQDITATIAITGTAAHPQIAFSSTPSLPQDEILSRLLFGASVADLSVAEAVQLASAVAGLQSGVDTMSKIRRGIGLDRLRLVGQDESTGMGSGLAIGKRLNRNLYAEVLTDSQGNTLTTVQWTLSRLWSLIAEVSSLGHSSLNASYRKEY
jgi:translocation and assembly module TamB